MCQHLALVQFAHRHEWSLHSFIIEMPIRKKKSQLNLNWNLSDQIWNRKHTILSPNPSVWQRCLFINSSQRLLGLYTVQPKILSNARTKLEHVSITVLSTYPWNFIRISNATFTVQRLNFLHEDSSILLNESFLDINTSQSCPKQWYCSSEHKLVLPNSFWRWSARLIHVEVHLHSFILNVSMRISHLSPFKFSFKCI